MTLVLVRVFINNIKSRFDELDSLRGLAALSVVFHHYLFVLPAISDEPNKFWYLKYTPAHLFWAGHEAVVFFFILSGFVLSLQFFKKKVEYRGYLIKRICRIYIPYLSVVIIAILASALFYSHPIADLSVWFNRVWTDKATIGLLLQHFTLLSSFDNNAYDPVLWSLVHEMRLSILFPLVMWCILRFNWKRNLGIACAATFICAVLTYICHRILNFHSDYPLTIHYGAMFIFGALLAKHRTELTVLYLSLSRISKYGLLILGVILYLFSWLSRPLFPKGFSFAEDWVISLGVILFIVSAIGSKNISRFLVLRPVVWLGKISYSVYLFHAVILLSLIHLFYGQIPLWMIWSLGLILTLVVSWFSYRFIEMPSMNLGKNIEKWMKW